MQNLSLLSDGELLKRLPVLARADREATAAVIAHLVEVERRRLYLEQACSNLVAYCRDRRSSGCGAIRVPQSPRR